MPRRRVPLLILAVVLAATLAVPSVWGAPRQVHSGGSSTGLFGRLWGAVVSLWIEAGCIIDPHGGCTVPGLDVGCVADPHGGCALPSTDSGCKIDPNGVCTPGS